MIGAHDRTADAAASQAARTGRMQALMVGLGPEIMAVETGLVREIIDPVPRTPVPGARPFLGSLINVRGNVIPLADLSQRLGLERSPVTERTRFVVLDLEIGDGPVTVAIIADEVHEVTEVEMSRTVQPPRVGSRWNPDLIRFIVRWGEEFVIVPDLELILGPQSGSGAARFRPLREGMENQ